MSQHALDVLEFGRVLERVAGRTGSDLARDRLLAFRPESDPASVARELSRVGATMDFVQEVPDWGMPPVPDLTSTLSQLSAAGVVLEPTQLHRVGILLNSSRRLSSEFEARGQGPGGRYQELATIAQSLVSRKEVEDRIGRTWHDLGQSGRDLHE